MEIETVMSVLNSQTSRNILRTLAKYLGFPQQSLTVSEILSDLRYDHERTVKYRESIYKALENLVESGLVEKQHEEGSGIRYRLQYSRILVDLQNMSVSGIV